MNYKTDINVTPHIRPRRYIVLAGYARPVCEILAHPDINGIQNGE